MNESKRLSPEFAKMIIEMAKKQPKEAEEIINQLIEKNQELNETIQNIIDSLIRREG